MSKNVENSGIILKAIAGFYYVEAGDGIFECKARGIMRKNQQKPLAGDRVIFEALDSSSGVVTQILPRKNCLVRPPVANVDRMFIISSHDTPSPNPLEIDRLTVIAEQNEIEPVIVFNKCDLGPMDHWREIYQKAGFNSIVTSCLTGQGCDELEELLKNCTSIFVGNSGVGKSSILNRLFPNLKLKTGEVSEKAGRGRHTTRHVELYPLHGGYVADTPGFSALDLEKAMLISKEKLGLSFREFNDFIGDCRFTSCSHTTEKGCAIKEAVEQGKIPKSRYNSYLSLYREVKDIKEWELKGRE